MELQRGEPLIERQNARGLGSAERPVAKTVEKSTGSRLRSLRRKAALGVTGLAFAAGITAVTTETGDASRTERAQASIEIATGLARSQTRSGHLYDSIGRRGTSRYGDEIGGYALLYTGAKYRNHSFIRAGIKATNNAVRTRKKHGNEWAFNVDAVASSYNLAKRYLRHRPSVRRAMKPWGEWLKRQRVDLLGLGARSRYENKDVQAAVALLETQRTGLRSTAPRAILGGGYAAGRESAKYILNREIPARASKVPSFVLSDPDHRGDPPAYHGLSAALFARGLALQGHDLSRRSRRVVLKLAETIDKMAGPDGDVSYWGRSGGQKWTLSSSAYALSVAARQEGVSQATRGRYWTIADRMTHRLAGYGAGPRAEWITPSFRRNITAAKKGLAGYERTSEYSGLSAAYLNLADANLPKGRVRATAAADRPSGRVIGQGSNKFATARHGRIWFAAKMTGGSSLQYGLGVHAFKRLDNGRWRDVIPARPRGGGSAGPSLVGRKNVAVPYGKAISAARNGSGISISGWFGGTGVRRAATLSVKPHPNGRCLMTTVENATAGRHYRFWPFFRGNRPPSLAGNTLYGNDGQAVGFEGGEVVASASVAGLAGPTYAPMTKQSVTVRSSGNGPLSIVYC